MIPEENSIKDHSEPVWYNKSHLPTKPAWDGGRAIRAWLMASARCRRYAGFSARFLPLSAVHPLVGPGSQLQWKASARRPAGDYRAPALLSLSTTLSSTSTVAGLQPAIRLALKLSKKAGELISSNEAQRGTSELLPARTLWGHLHNLYLAIPKLRQIWRWQLLMWVIIWVIIPGKIFFCINGQAMDNRQKALVSMCDERARMFQEQFNVSMNHHLQALAILIATFHHSKNPSTIEQMTFARYTERTAFERTLMSGLAYAVRVTHPEREQFERQQGWSFKKMYSSKNQSLGPGDAEVSEPAEEYSPVFFAQDAYKHVVSFDLLFGTASTLPPPWFLLLPFPESSQDFIFPKVHAVGNTLCPRK
ncbi:hypothetical protein ACP70R_048227 [Stipagrostis hirtigluma subsp. patula]